MSSVKIPGHNNYTITESGEVFSNTRTDRAGRKLSGRWLRPTVRKDGYVCVRLGCDDGVTRLRFVHRLVLETFAGPQPRGMEACHNDGVRSNNHLSNLRWDTRSNNAKDAVKHGTSPVLKMRKLSYEDEKRIVESIDMGWSQRSLAKRFGVCPSTICNVAKRMGYNYGNKN